MSSAASRATLIRPEWGCSMVSFAPDQEPQTDTQAQQQTGQSQARYMRMPEPPEIQINGRFDKYRSSYWAGAMAALGLRYFAKAPVRHLFQDDVASETKFFKKHSYSAASGAIISMVAGYYGMQTYKDIKSILSEVVGWEMGKDPKDVTMGDFFKSKNSVVHQTMGNFVKFNTRRFGINIAYFTPFIFHKTFKAKNLHGEWGADMGLAVNGAYLLNDVLHRKMTPFEEMQTLIDNKINHATHYADTFVATDLVDIYERHAEHDKNKSFMSQRGTPQWDKSVAVFRRMADLMNQSYGNEPAHEYAQFGFSKFTHLLGTHKIDPDHMDRTMAYVEISNRYGVHEVDKAEKDFERGATVEQVLAQYPEAKLPESYNGFSAGGIAQLPEENRFRSRVTSQPMAESFAEREASKKAVSNDFPQLGV